RRVPPGDQRRRARRRALPRRHRRRKRPPRRRRHPLRLPAGAGRAPHRAARFGGHRDPPARAADDRAGDLVLSPHRDRGRSSHGAGRVMGATAAVYRVECRKLLAQPRVRSVLAVLLVAPWIFIGLLLHQDRLPLETLYGRYLKDTGYATPLVILVYSVQWLLPLIASLMAGDVFSSEDQSGTLKTILTRSVDRSAVFWGKVGAAFTMTTLAVVTVAASSTLAGVMTVGNDPLIDVGGTLHSASSALGLVA